MRISFPFTNFQLLVMSLCLTRTTTDRLSPINVQHSKEEMILKKQKSHFCRIAAIKGIPTLNLFYHSKAQ